MSLTHELKKKQKNKTKFETLKIKPNSVAGNTKIQRNGKGAVMANMDQQHEAWLSKRFLMMLRPNKDRWSIEILQVYHVSYVFRQGSDTDLKEFIPKDRH